MPGGFNNVVAIAAGRVHNLALTADGQVLGWGNNVGNRATAPSGLSNVVAIAVAGGHSMALTAEGRVVAWGSNNYGQTNVSSGLSNVVAIAAGDYHSLALVGAPSAGFGPRFLMATVDQPFRYWIMAGNDTTYGATGLPPGLVLDPNTGLLTGQPQQAGTYSVVLSTTNSAGARVWTVTLVVNEPPAPVIVSSGIVLANFGLAFSYDVLAFNGPTWYGASGLPLGLAIDPLSGAISGVPEEAGDFVVSLVASNRNGLGTGSLTIRVPLVAVVGWGNNANGQVSPPVGLSNVVALTAGTAHCLALTAEGGVVGWGRDTYGAIRLPNGLANVVAIAAGGDHSLALTVQGRVMGWGQSNYRQTNAPMGLSNVAAIAAGESHSVALTSSGQVVAWGRNNYGQTNVPTGLSRVVAIAAGGAHNLALTTEGQVVGWGRNDYGQSTAPGGLSHVVAIAAGGLHSLALTADGQVVAWGAAISNQTMVPIGLSNVVAIAAGSHHSLALTANGQVVTWGDTTYGQTTVPSGLSHVVAIAAGGWHSLALMRQPTVPAPSLKLSSTGGALELHAHGASGISCQLLRASSLPGPWLPAEPVSLTNAVHPLSVPDTSQPIQFFRLLRK